MVIFTDGAGDLPGLSPGAAPRVGVGGVIFSGAMRNPEYFSCVVPTELVELWKEGGLRQQVIGQAELLPIVLARLIWAQYLKGQPVLFFIDNESARFALIKGTSPATPSGRLVSWAAALDAKHGTSPWYARVPSSSNCAGAPSRLIQEVPGFPGASRVGPDVSDTGCDLWRKVARYLEVAPWQAF